MTEVKATDRVGWKAEWQIHKFNDPTGEIANALKAGAPMEDFAEHMVGFEEMHDNLGLNEGLQAMLTLLIGGGGTAFGNAAAYLGVGDSATAAAATQTGLQAATNKVYVAMDSTYPQRTNQTMDWRSTFAAGTASWNWQEYTVANGNSDASTNLNRKVEDKGTKAAGEAWTLSLQITFS